MQQFTRPTRTVATSETMRLSLGRVSSWSHDKVDELGHGKHRSCGYNDQESTICVSRGCTLEVWMLGCFRNAQKSAL